MNRKHMGGIAAAAGLVLIAGIAGFTSTADAGKPNKAITQIAADAGVFNTLLAAIDAAGLRGTLTGQGQGPFTVFAPTDEAFAKLAPGTVESLLADPEALKNILLYHVVPGTVPASDVGAATSLTTANGQDIRISVSGDVMINESAKVTAKDIMARNGIIHIIDSVLLPPN